MFFNPLTNNNRTNVRQNANLAPDRPHSSFTENGLMPPRRFIPRMAASGPQGSGVVNTFLADRPIGVGVPSLRTTTDESHEARLRLQQKNTRTEHENSFNTSRGLFLIDPADQPQREANKFETRVLAGGLRTVAQDVPDFNRRPQTNKVAFQPANQFSVDQAKNKPTQGSALVSGNQAGQARVQMPVRDGGIGRSGTEIGQARWRDDAVYKNNLIVTTGAGAQWQTSLGSKPADELRSNANTDHVVRGEKRAHSDIVHLTTGRMQQASVLDEQTPFRAKIAKQALELQPAVSVAAGRRVVGARGVVGFAESDANHLKQQQQGEQSHVLAVAPQQQVRTEAPRNQKVALQPILVQGGGATFTRTMQRNQLTVDTHLGDMGAVQQPLVAGVVSKPARRVHFQASTPAEPIIVNSSNNQGTVPHYVTEVARSLGKEHLARGRHGGKY